MFSIEVSQTGMKIAITAICLVAVVIALALLMASNYSISKLSMFVSIAKKLPLALIGSYLCVIMIRDIHNSRIILGSFAFVIFMSAALFIDIINYEKQKKFKYRYV